MYTFEWQTGLNEKIVAYYIHNNKTIPIVITNYKTVITNTLKAMFT